MSHDPKAIAEARALMACIRVTRDPAEQNRLWNRYYRISDEVFPEAAVLRTRYKGMVGEERRRFKAEYMELVRRLWLATDPETAYDEPLTAEAAPKPLPTRNAGGRTSAPVHRWALAAIGLVALGVGAYVAVQFANSGEVLPWQRSALVLDTADLEESGELPPQWVPTPPAPEAPEPEATPADPPESLPSPPEEIAVDEIEAALADEIKPNFKPVPSHLSGKGDQLVAGDKTYTDVYVIESDSTYYIRIPAKGAVESVLKANAELDKSADDAAREALLALWHENREAIALAEARREEEKVRRVAARRRANERQAERRRAALEEASWQAKAQEWRDLTEQQRHGARLRAYSDWQSIQGDAETLEELYLNISRTYEYIGVNDSRMAALQRNYSRAARRVGPDYDMEDAFMIYGWGREEILRQLAEWEAQYYELLDYVNEHYPVYESRVNEIEKLDATLPEQVRQAEAIDKWGEDPEGKPRVGVGFGTGFIVAKDRVMTCAHVVRGASTIRVTTTKGKLHSATVVATDAANDWCILKVEELAGDPIPMATKTPNVGATIYCLGFPLGGIKDSNDPIVGSGNVAALQRIDGDNRFIQITAPINPGNSGGPVLDQQGRWVGIVSQKLSDLHSLQTSQSVAQGLNYAVKASHVLPLARSAGAQIQVARGGGGAESVMALETINSTLAPSIVKIEVQ